MCSVPTADEFITLDKVFGNSGVYTEPGWDKIEATYLGEDSWGGHLGGVCTGQPEGTEIAGTLFNQNYSAAYWASTEYSTNGRCLYIARANETYGWPACIDVSGGVSKYDQGQSLRCVKTI
jgi:hypothetical protein